jgi:hypothetical protein
MSRVVPEPHETRAVKVVLQFLREQHLDASFEALLAESGLDPAPFYNCNANAAGVREGEEEEEISPVLYPPHTLLTALDRYLDDERVDSINPPPTQETLLAKHMREIEQQLVRV